ncbi:hypothetical protein, partial [Lentilactobacillus otakiensis]|uniref:hypothetical protein n=1 Tax=Lentilactobacillus otakiensis TaxID=481720 RepID=UPI001CC169DE
VSKYQDAVITTFSRFNSINTTAGNADRLRHSYFENKFNVLNTGIIVRKIYNTATSTVKSTISNVKESTK